ncbi:MAG: DUF1203 domain-containing protein, partial [Fimbriimonadaceae bacterium]|nr:DUF1203 domain-containing protein [Alphaproteobacteria bacterium]
REVALRVYDADDTMLYAQSGLVRGGDVDKKVRKILKDPEVAKIHIRTAQYGCFLCEVVRV